MQDKLVNIKVRETTRELLKIEARKQGITLNDLIRRLLDK